MGDLDDQAQQQVGSQDPQSQSHAGQQVTAGQHRIGKRREDDDGDDDDAASRERRKIEIKFIQDKSRRHITFSKRKAGIMKKAYELSVLTGTQVLLLVVSETGLVYTFTTPKLQPLVTKSEGKNLIQACLNAPEPTESDVHQDTPPEGSPEANDIHPSMQRHAQQPTHGPPLGAPTGYGIPNDPSTYQAYLHDQRQHYGHPPTYAPHDPR